MKFAFGLLCFGLAIVFAQAAIGSYDYCGKPCTDSGSITCAYNQVCYNVFINPCEMKKRNCDFDDRFLQVGLASCLLSANKCRF
ncbi:unnamed protein product [Hermetia illucens]|uniref:Uncharacterized protein n=1 Tax=Hermetia illucens TaxID=343691 RepID=A0A7R8UI70_HERIL|nr:uncharacterized protein LOC119648342 [Hermetia illucens]CAD7081332.1 unnamed protein product [Hermetia illucens]